MKKLAFSLLALAAPVAAFAGSHASGSGMGWFATHLLSALIHAVVYGVIFKLFHALGLFPSIIVGAAILGGAYWWYRRQNPGSN